MKDKLIPVMALCLLLAVGVPALAQVSANHDLSWHVIAGGGGRMASTGHTLVGSIGQPLTGASSSTGHTLCSGFWCSGVVQQRIYLPLVLRNFP